MKYPFAIIASLCFGTVCLFNIYSCNKAPDTVATPQPIDSTNTKTTASKNCIDSIIGIYYGHRETRDTQYSFGTATPGYNYSGPDTVIVKRIESDSSEFTLYSILFVGPTDIYKFDTSRILPGIFGGSFLHLFPEVDSISFRYDYLEGNIYAGQKITSYFTGKK